MSGNTYAKFSSRRLRHKITLLRKTDTPNGKGGFVTAWPVFAVVFADVIGINGREAVIAQALQGVSYFKITIRYRDDVTDADQITYDARTLNIRSISDPDGRREQLMILADTASTMATV